MISNNYNTRKLKEIERKCAFCGSTNTSIGTKTRGDKIWQYENWCRWKGKMACSKCYKQQYDWARPRHEKRQKLDGIEKKCVICGTRTTRIDGTKRCDPYPRWYCHEGGAICYRCKIRLLARNRARKNNIPERQFHENRPLVQLIRKCVKYLIWRENVLKRDNYSCVDCGSKTIYLQAHHIKPFLEILQENAINSLTKALACEKLWDIDNGLTVCAPCHGKRDPRKHGINNV
jgi:5-methylcytosine-specific restriction endonuclease McrA